MRFIAALDKALFNTGHPATYSSYPIDRNVCPTSNRVGEGYAR